MSFGNDSILFTAGSYQAKQLFWRALATTTVYQWWSSATAAYSQHSHRMQQLIHSCHYRHFVASSQLLHRWRQLLHSRATFARNSFSTAVHLLQQQHSYCWGEGHLRQCHLKTACVTLDTVFIAALFIYLKVIHRFTTDNSLLLSPYMYLLHCVTQYNHSAHGITSSIFTLSSTQLLACCFKHFTQSCISGITCWVFLTLASQLLCTQHANSFSPCAFSLHDSPVMRTVLHYRDLPGCIQLGPVSVSVCLQDSEPSPVV